MEDGFDVGASFFWGYTSRLRARRERATPGHTPPRRHAAFGLRATNKPIGRWPQLVEQWLHTIGMLG